MKTLVAQSTHLFARGFPHGAEVPPGLLSQAEIDRLVDERKLEELDSGVRRSIYRLFPEFSGVALDPAVLDSELARFALPQ